MFKHSSKISCLMRPSFKAFHGEKVLVTGCSGQIGRYLVQALVNRYGSEGVICSDLKQPSWKPPCHFKFLDITNTDHFEDIVRHQKIKTVYHMAAMLSSVSESFPDLSMKVNVEANFNLLKLARKRKFKYNFN